MTDPTPAPQPADPVAWCRSDDFRDSLLKRQSFSGWREPHPDCDMALYAQPQATGPSLEEVGTLISWLGEKAIEASDAGSSKDAGMLTWAAQVVGERVDEDAPDADQAEGPSVDDVAELCAEFEYQIDSDDDYSLGILRDVITAAITRWRAPVAQTPAQPVNLAELHDPGFSGGLTPSQHLDVVHGGADPRAAAAASTELPPRAGHILRLAEIIREVDSQSHSDTFVLGAAALAEAILAHPGFSSCHDGPVAAPAQTEVAELVAALEADAECVAAEHYDLCNMRVDQMRRIAELLNGIPHA